MKSLLGINSRGKKEHSAKHQIICVDFQSCHGTFPRPRQKSLSRTIKVIFGHPDSELCIEVKTQKRFHLQQKQRNGASDIRTAAESAWCPAHECFYWYVRNMDMDEGCTAPSFRLQDFSSKELVRLKLMALSLSNHYAKAKMCHQSSRSGTADAKTFAANATPTYRQRQLK